MLKITKKESTILNIILKRGQISSSNLHNELEKVGEEISLVTVKRALSNMSEAGILDITGSGPSTNYEVSIQGRLFADIDAKDYCSTDPDKRYGLSNYNFELLSKFPLEIFDKNELISLDEATSEYEKRTIDLSDIIKKKELERLIIELSWKSSKIEGNTYSLLDTEKLILENKEAFGHSKAEARMILNHKDAFTYIHLNKDLFQSLTSKNLEELHAIIVKDLDIAVNFRQKPVGVLGSKYRPLDNKYQITEAVENLALVISKIHTPYAKALVALLGISYIQPFEDGNKRTSRLMANALLLANGCAPLSYRSVDENEYREAMLVFYEINSLSPFKKIFIDQYKFATINYAVK